MHVQAFQEMGSRTHQEDAYCVSPPAVFDGMGGAEGGKEASWTAAQEVERLYRQAPDTPARELLAQAHLMVGNGIGATTAVLFQPHTQEIGWVGDSRAYLIRDGVVTALTTDHTVPGALFTLGRIAEDEYQLRARKSVMILTALGAPTLQVNVVPFSPVEGDRLVLISDGYLMETEEALRAALVKSPLRLEVARDNATCVVVSF